MTEFCVFVSYAQLAVFRSDLQNPFNDWTAKHVDQGFSWRPGSVSFRSLADSGIHSVSVDVVDELEPMDPLVIRAVDVPFEVPENGCIEVGSISDAKPLSLEPGTYLLRCEFLNSEPGRNERVRIRFSKNDAPCFAIPRADPGLRIEGELVNSAEPASA